MMPGLSLKRADYRLMTLNPIETGLLIMRGARLGLCILGFLAGCHVPPARPVACDRNAPRKLYLTRQLVGDTAVNAVYHPVRTGYNLATEPVAYLRAGAVGLFYKRLALPFFPAPPPIDPNRPTLDPEALEAKLRRAARNELEPAAIRLAVDGAEALAALNEVIDSATCRIDVLMYLWDSDPLGEAVAARLAARAAAGSSVRVLVDGGGNLIDGLPKKATSAEVNRVVCWLARQPHVELVRTRNPVARFDHRKLVVADGRLAWSGGRNFTQPSFFEYHDLSYTLAGPLAGEMATLFEDFWKRQGGTPALAALPPPPPLEVANASARLLRTRSIRRQLAEVLYRAVDQARHHVYAENPYFSDPRLLTKLALARQRGADVRVVLTIHGDSEILDKSNKVTANRLLRAGIRVYLYPGMTHVKATTVDGCWAYLGTGNFDALSLRHNRELGLAVAAGPVVTALEEQLFLPDFRPEWELKEPLPLGCADYLAESAASLFF
jgi:cardiolipin synthase A/B